MGTILGIHSALKILNCKIYWLFLTVAITSVAILHMLFSALVLLRQKGIHNGRVK